MPLSCLLCFSLALSIRRYEYHVRRGYFWIFSRFTSSGVTGYPIKKHDLHCCYVGASRPNETGEGGQTQQRTLAIYLPLLCRHCNPPNFSSLPFSYMNVPRRLLSWLTCLSSIGSFAYILLFFSSLLCICASLGNAWLLDERSVCFWWPVFGWSYTIVQLEVRWGYRSDVVELSSSRSFALVSNAGRSLQRVGGARPRVEVSTPGATATIAHRHRAHPCQSGLESSYLETHYSPSFEAATLSGSPLVEISLTSSSSYSSSSSFYFHFSGAVSRSVKAAGEMTTTLETTYDYDYKEETS